MQRKTLIFFYLTAVMFYLLWDMVYASQPMQWSTPMSDWKEWVLYEKKEQQCPVVSIQTDQHRCVWPGVLALDLTDQGGDFTQRVEILQSSWFLLPGNKEQWPLDVQVAGVAVPVVMQKNKPAIYLEPGNYTVSGHFQWTALPDTLDLSDDTALISLHLQGKLISNFALNDKHQLILLGNASAGSTQNVTADALTIRVFRLLQDGVPFKMQTLLQLTVAGRAREIDVGPVLFNDQLPMSVSSELPLRFTDHHQVRMQIKPGVWQVMIGSRDLQKRSTWTLAKVQNPAWPSVEFWSFAADPAVRRVNIEGVTRVDPTQVEVPNQWQQYPTFAVKAGETLTLIDEVRGSALDEPNRLNLWRQVWLDFAGTGYTLQDRIDGQLYRDWRLNVFAPLQLGRMSLNGQDQVITTLDDKTQGVEIRDGNVHAMAALRQNSHTLFTLPANGWDQTMDSVNMTLHVPPAWNVLHVWGVDQVTGTWVEQWSLLDIFLVLVLTLAAFKLGGRVLGTLTFITLLLIYHQPGIWIGVWLNVFVALALLQVVQAMQIKRIRWFRWYWWLSYALLWCMALPFLVQEARGLLYPQWEMSRPPVIVEPMMMAGVSSNARMEKGGMMLAVAPVVAMDMNAQEKAPETIQSDWAAQVQTGPALPTWQGKDVQLSWQGSVKSDQNMHVWFISPLENRLLHLLRMVFYIALAALLWNVLAEQPIQWRKYLHWRRSMAVLPALFLCGSLWSTKTSAADYPSADLLQTLQTRLLEPAACFPHCVELALAKVTVNDHQLTLDLSYDAATPSAAAIPYANNQWQVQSVRINGGDALTARFDDQSALLYLPSGRTQVMITATINTKDRLNIYFPTLPHLLQTRLDGWQADNVSRLLLLNNPLQLSASGTSMQISNIDNTQTLIPVIPPFAQVQRILSVDQDWTLKTIVTRVAPSEGGSTLKVPLLPGESVISSDLTIEDRQVVVHFDAGQNQFSWDSRVTPAETLTWKAVGSNDWIEQWQVIPSDKWHLAWNDLAPDHQKRPGRFQPFWQPWPGESVTWLWSKPKALVGNTLTIDSVQLQLLPAQRSRDSVLNLNVRSSLGGKHSIVLPDDASVQSVSIDGQAQSIFTQDNLLTLSVHPGQQRIEIRSQQPSGLSAWFAAPVIDLKQAAGNIETRVQLPVDRWILWLKGPLMGPSLLFWGVVISMILIGLIISKCTPQWPIRAWDWIILSMGLITASLWTMAWVLIWFALFTWRMHVKSTEVNTTWQRVRFNGIQIGLAMFTFITVSTLFAAISNGLIGSPQTWMTSPDLSWYQDRVTGELPEIAVFSLPIWVYRVAMLLWALWLAVRSLKWLRWGWDAFGQGGLWRAKE